MANFIIKAYGIIYQDILRHGYEILLAYIIFVC